jgi:hypothetical protein
MARNSRPGAAQAFAGSSPRFRARDARAQPRSDRARLGRESAARRLSYAAGKVASEELQLEQSAADLLERNVN